MQWNIQWENWFFSIPRALRRLCIQRKIQSQEGYSWYATRKHCIGTISHFASYETNGYNINSVYWIASRIQHKINKLCWHCSESGRSVRIFVAWMCINHWFLAFWSLFGEFLNICIKYSVSNPGFSRLNSRYLIAGLCHIETLVSCWTIRHLFCSSYYNRLTLFCHLMFCSNFFSTFCWHCLLYSFSSLVSFAVEPRECWLRISHMPFLKCFLQTLCACSTVNSLRGPLLLVCLDGITAHNQSILWWTGSHLWCDHHHEWPSQASSFSGILWYSAVKISTDNVMFFYSGFACHNMTFHEMYGIWNNLFYLFTL